MVGARDMLLDRLPVCTAGPFPHDGFHGQNPVSGAGAQRWDYDHRIMADIIQLAQLFAGREGGRKGQQVHNADTEAMCSM